MGPALICYDLRYQPLAIGDFIDYLEVGKLLRQEVVVSYDPLKPVIDDPNLKHINVPEYLRSLAGLAFIYPYQVQHDLPDEYNFYRICALVEKLGPVPLEFEKEWAKAFLEKHEIRYSLQLRNNPHNIKRNSDYPAWLAFLKKRTERFVLLGDVPPEFRLKNTVLAKGSLKQDLSLISACDAHIGVSSGPGQVAVYGEKPYCLFMQTVKPERCSQFQIKGNEGRWSWAKPGQFFPMLPQVEKYLHQGFNKCL